MLCRFRLTTTVLVCVVALSAHLIAGENANDSDKIKELHQKRVELRTRILNLVTAGYMKGAHGLDQVLDAQSSLLVAKLALCETKEQRLRAYDEVLEQAERALKGAKALFAAGEATEVDVVKAEARILEGEIGRETAKAAK